MEAIDATYSMGYVNALFSALIAGILPPKNAEPALRIIKKFAKEASKHWFKQHVSVHDLANIKVYETVRKAISFNFRPRLDDIVHGLSLKTPVTAFINYASVFHESNHFWS